MYQGVLQRPALGQSAELGTLYDARSDFFLPLSLLRQVPPAAAVTVTENHGSEIQYSYKDTYVEKLSKMGLYTELGASFLSGTVLVGGSGRYLTDTRDSNQVMQASIIYKLATVHEKLNFMADLVTKGAFQTGMATHVVSEISWGAQSIVTAKHRLSNNEDRAKINFCLQANLRDLRSTTSVSEIGGFTIEMKKEDKEIPFEVTVYSDVVADDGLLSTDFLSASEFINNVPRYVEHANAGKGKPLMYKLLPLPMLAFVFDVDIRTNMILRQPSIRYLERFVLLFDSLRDAQRNLNDYHFEISKHQYCVPPDHVHDVFKQLQHSKAAQTHLKEYYARILKDVKSGVTDSGELLNLLRVSSERKVPPEEIAKFMDRYRDKMTFADKVIAMGVKYIGYQGGSLEEELTKIKDEDAYVVHFNENLRAGHESWEGTQHLLIQLFKPTERKYLVIVLDYDFNNKSLGRSYISQHWNSRLVVPDLFKHYQSLGDDCYVQYDEELLDESTPTRPPERRLVELPCAGRHCGSSPRYEWTCIKCHAPIEYGCVDQYLYCDCGRHPYENSAFKCKEVWHGSAFARHRPEQLRQLLDALEPYDELNILILGETGVGKSTFINAFINYLSFDSLEDAMGHEKLNWVIPCSFTLQHLVRDQRHPNGKFERTAIEIGQSDDEHNNDTGESATQRTFVYAVTRGTMMIRLIDTPGLCDTRGVQHDGENMANIFSTLENIPKLHGILILLKPNHPRLTPVFRSSINQFLTRLHRDAVQNVAFGFTNTRGSNYSTGESFGPLTTLLQEHNESGLGLWPHTVYCFDSESFRFLAAYSRGVQMVNVQDFHQSWEHSAEETRRLLQHYRTLRPHLVSSTTSLNRLRELLSSLTKPMIESKQVIETNKLHSQKKAKELKQAELEGEKLRALLFHEKFIIKSHLLDAPRLVCCDPSCTEYKEDANGTLITVYKTPCQDVCYLTDVGVALIGDPGVLKCAIFNGGVVCSQCGHHWKSHFQVLYELRSELVTVCDDEIQQQLVLNADAIKIKRTVIAALEKGIGEKKKELEAIQSTLAKFIVVIKKKSITSYEDSTIAYLDNLIQEEAKKILAGASSGPRDSFKRFREEHEQRMQVLIENINDGNEALLTEDDVGRLLRELYALPLYGQALKPAIATTEVAPLAMYHEMIYRVPKKTNVWN